MEDSFPLAMVTPGHSTRMLFAIIPLANAANTEKNCNLFRMEVSSRGGGGGVFAHSGGGMFVRQNGTKQPPPGSSAGNSKTPENEKSD